MQTSTSSSEIITAGRQPENVIVNEIRQLITTRTGIHIHTRQLNKLASVIRHTCHHFGYTHTDQLLRKLLTHSNSQELEQLVSGITIGESFFFRDDTQIRFLQDFWLPKLIKQRRKSGHKMIRIWSAGCSAGQELYTVAMILNEILEDVDSWHIHLLGTDINTIALSQAVRGMYTDWSLRNTPLPIREKYFSRQEDKYQLIPSLRHMVKFAYLNLIEDGYPSIFTETVALDLILCRNVFIYFDQSWIHKVLTRFSDCLVPEGIIVLGASDMVEELPQNLTLKISQDAIYYNHHGHILPEKTAINDCKTSAHPQKVSVRKKRKTAHTTAGNSNQDHRIKRKKEKQAQLKKSLFMRSRDNLLALSQKNDWEQLLYETESYQKNEPVGIVYKSWALANLGKLSDAERLIRSCIDRGKTLPEAQFVYAMIRMDTDYPEEAGQAFRKALFLERNFPEAHYQFGLLLLREGEQEAGLKSLMNALSLTSQPDLKQMFLLGMDYSSIPRFAEILANEIDIYLPLATHDMTRSDQLGSASGHGS